MSDRINNPISPDHFILPDNIPLQPVTLPVAKQDSKVPYKSDQKIPGLSHNSIFSGKSGSALSTRLRALLPQAKCKPYFPVSRELQHYSGFVYPQGEIPDDSGASAPTCLHFALAYFLSDDKPAFLKSVGNLSDIEKTSGGRIASLYKNFCSIWRVASLDNKKVIVGRQMGDYISSIIRMLSCSPLSPPDANGKHKSGAHILIETPDHVLSMQIQRKENDMGEDYFSVEMYDPNVTTNHVRMLTQGDKTLENMAFQDLLHTNFRESYNIGEDVPLSMLCRITETAAFDHSPENTENDFSITTPWQNCSIEMQAGGMYVAMAGDSPDFINMLSKIIHSPAVSQSQKIALLKADNPEGNPGLHTALYRGNTRAITAWGAAIQRAGLTPDEIKSLLEASCNDVPGIHIVLQEGHTEAMLAYVKIMRDLNVEPKTFIDLISAKDADGVHGLHLAIAGGHSETVKHFADMVEKLDIPSEDKKYLLAPIHEEPIKWDTAIPAIPETKARRKAPPLPVRRS